MSFTVTTTTPSKDKKGINLNFANQLPTDSAGLDTSGLVNPDNIGTSKSFGGSSGMTNDINVLKKKSTITFKDLNTLEKAKAAQRLQSLNSNAERNLEEEASKKRFFNLSIKEIIDKTIITVIQIFSELLEIEESGKKAFNEVAKIFLKEDRMIYVGVFFVVLSVLLMLLFLSS